MSLPVSASQKVADTLQRAIEPMTVDDICYAVYGRTGDRERNNVYQTLHRLTEKQKVIKLPARFAWRGAEIPY